MTESVTNWRRQRERMQVLLETLAKRKPGPETLRTQLKLMLNAYAATGLDIDELQRSVQGVCPCCLHSALGGCDSKHDKLLRKHERQAWQIAIVYAKLGDLKLALAYFRETNQVDIGGAA